MIKVFGIWLTFLGVAVLNACAHQDAGADRMGWNLAYDEAADVAKLAYGQPNSDHVGLIMSCSGGGGAVTLAGHVTPERPVLTLASGRRSAKFGGRAEADPLSGGLYLESQAGVNDAVLDNFARTGKLSVIEERRAIVMPASAEERAKVRAFFTHCA